MTVLHIFRSAPDEVVRTLAQAQAPDAAVIAVRLDEAPVDYDRLVDLIFQSDRVYCWP